jgi:hypothetical protein
MNFRNMTVTCPKMDVTTPSLVLAISPEGHLLVGASDSVLRWIDPREWEVTIVSVYFDDFERWGDNFRRKEEHGS